MTDVELQRENERLCEDLDAEKKKSSHQAKMLAGMSALFLAQVLAAFSVGQHGSYQRGRENGHAKGEADYSKFVDDNPYIHRLTEEEMRAQNPHHFQVNQEEG